MKKVTYCKAQNIDMLIFSTSLMGLKFMNLSYLRINSAVIQKFKLLLFPSTALLKSTMETNKKITISQKYLENKNRWRLFDSTLAAASLIMSHTTIKLLLGIGILGYVNS